MPLSHLSRQEIMHTLCHTGTCVVHEEEGEKGDEDSRHRAPESTEGGALIPCASIQ